MKDQILQVCRGVDGCGGAGKVKVMSENPYAPPTYQSTPESVSKPKRWQPPLVLGIVIVLVVLVYWLFDTGRPMSAAPGIPMKRVQGPVRHVHSPTLREIKLLPVQPVARASTEIRRPSGRIEHHHVDRGLADVDPVLRLGEVFLKAEEVILALRTLN